MTHQIGAGTCNVPINMPIEERAIIGRLACRLDLSAGALLRKLIGDAMAREFPDEAARLARIEARRVRRAVAMLIVGLLAVCVEFVRQTDLRQAPRGGARVVRIAREEAV